MKTNPEPLLTVLTPEQRAEMPRIRDEWIAIGLSTEPADRPRAERGIALAYRAGRKQVPKNIVWCGSPLSQGLTRAIVLGSFASVRDSVGASVWDSVGASVRDSVVDNVWASVGDSVRASVGDSVWDSVGDSVRDSVRASVWDSVGASVWDSVVDNVWDSVVDNVGASVRDSVWASVYGQHDAGWLAFYRYFHEVCGLSAITAPINGIWEIAQSAGWWLPHENTCWISERPSRLRRNASGQLHCPDGAALGYPDGWCIYALNGVRVPRVLAEAQAEQLDAREWVLKQPNAEIRREAVRKIGIERVCAALGATVMARGLDHAGQPCDLLNLDLGDGRRRPYIKLRHPGTGTYHLEGVPPGVATIKQAFVFRNREKGAPQWLR